MFGLNKGTRYNDNYSTTYADVYPSNNSIIPDGGNGAAYTTGSFAWKALPGRPCLGALPGSHYVYMNPMCRLRQRARVGWQNGF